MFSKEEGCIFFRTPLAKVKVEEGGGEIFYGFRFVDIKDNHVWLEVGTNYDDSYYPYCVFNYFPKLNSTTKQKEIPKKQHTNKQKDNISLRLTRLEKAVELIIKLLKDM